AFLNNVVTSTIVFEGNGKVGEYVGGYDDWLSQRPRLAAEGVPGKIDRKKARPRPKTRSPRKLGYLQQREIQELPRKIEALESEQKRLFAVMSDPSFYKKEKDHIAGVKADLDRVEREIETAYRRWEELEAIKSKADDR
ncbi:MAG: ABC transporter ATP-binding protein, partial [Desulfobacterales bacterium]